MSNRFKVGDRVRVVEACYNERQRVGAEATVIALDADGDPILDSDPQKEVDHGWGWNTDWLELVTPAAPAITPLDDAGRAALKAGDRVLVEAKVVDVRPDKDGDIRVQRHYGGFAHTIGFAHSSSIYALLPPAPEPIAAGDTVRIMGGQVGKAIGQASDGTWAVEYDAGDSINISRYDASALEVVS